MIRSISNSIADRIANPLSVAYNHVFSLGVASGLQILDINLRFPTNKVIEIDWGDGNSSSIIGAGGAVNVQFTHTYAAVGLYIVKLKGDYDSLTLLDCRSNTLSGSVESWPNLSYLTYLNCRSNDLIGKLPKITANDSAPLAYYAYENHFSDADLKVFRRAMTVFDIKDQKQLFPTSNIDKLLKNLADFYEKNTPTASCTINMSGSNMGIPTNGAANLDLNRLVEYYTAAGRTCNVLISSS